VVGDFVTLKKRGANLLGLCPFHNEKTPSFTVSQAKGIYKCFGCGAAGNSVNFIMQHESLSYPESLKYLARKYAIQVEEKEVSPEEKAAQNEKESLYITASFAQKYFSENLKNTDEGKSVGLGYFKERGFRDDIIEKFQMGYSLEGRRAFTEAAVKAGYKPEYLVKTGLSILSDKHNTDVAEEGKEKEINPAHLFDRYSGRVIFPIHNVSGRVIGFGGRILNNDKKLAKYINSPQTDIYDKSKVLYGLFFAKKSITQEDNCFLVEGYTDVTSMHQAGIENVVASSGTSLTVEQIRLIHRFTNNITILYDGDFAGIKASFRGIDLILEEGMNVRVLLFPDNEDPDSYSKRVSPGELKKFIRENTTDFIRFKTNLLFEEAKNDPIKKAGLIKDIVESISLIPDAINRSVYIKECSRILDIEEQVLNLEMNKLRLKKSGKGKPEQKEELVHSQANALEMLNEIETEMNNVIPLSDYQEREIARLLLNHGNKIIETEIETAEGEETTMPITVAELILYEILHDGIEITNSIYAEIISIFRNRLINLEIPEAKLFLQNEDASIVSAAIDLSSPKYSLSKGWEEKYGILVTTDENDLVKWVRRAVYSIKEFRLREFITHQKSTLREQLDEIDQMNLLIKIKYLEDSKLRVNRILGRIIVGDMKTSSGQP
jgi:DNA primase